MAATTPMSEWGKDHWSTLAYLETCCVDNDGYLDNRRMNSDGEAYPTRLRGNTPETPHLAPGHNDWDCVADMISAGLVKPAPGTTPMGRVSIADQVARVAASRGHTTHFQARRYLLTPAGLKIAAALRAHKAAGGNFASFVPPGRNRV